MAIFHISFHVLRGIKTKGRPFYNRSKLLLLGLFQAFIPRTLCDRIANKSTHCSFLFELFFRDECEVDAPCEAPAQCEDTVGSFMCLCPDGYRLNTPTTCEGNNKGLGRNFLIKAC